MQVMVNCAGKGVEEQHRGLERTLTKCPSTHSPDNVNGLAEVFNQLSLVLQFVVVRLIVSVNDLPALYAVSKATERSDVNSTSSILSI